MRPFFALLVATALAACGKEPATEGAAAAPAPPHVSTDAAAPPAPPPSRREAPPPPAPTPLLSLLVNGQGADAKVVPGWPVVVEVRLASPDGKPWRVAGGSAPWSRLARLEQSGDSPWPFELASEAPHEVTVDDRNAATLHWTIAPEVSARLAKGERTLVAVLEAAPSGDGAWSGAARSTELRVSVVDEPRPLPPTWAERRAEVEVDFALLREGAAAALARADAAVAAQPKRWRLAAMRGNLLAKLDRRVEAIAALDRAIDLWHEHAGSECGPPWELVAAREALGPDAPEAAPPPETPRAPAPLQPVEPEGKPLQLSGLVLSPPRGWTRDDGGGVPGFRPAKDPCRLFVLPARELQGTAKEAHDALVAAMLSANSPVGAVTSGERRRFRWSAGRLRDAKGSEAWFAVYTVAAEGRLEAILFQADTREAYDAHLSAVESVIDGASPAAAPKAGAEEFGNVRFVRPSGWSREERDGALWLVPPGVPAGNLCAAVIAPGEELAGSVREWFDKAWSEVAAGGTVTGGELETRRGNGFGVLVRSAIVEREGRSLVVAVVAFTPGRRVESIVYLADGRELFDAHLAAVDKMIAGIGFKNLDGAAPAAARLEGAWWRLEHMFDAASRSREPQNYFLFFYEGGLACRKWNADGPDGLDPAWEMTIADAKWGEWGRRTETAEGVTVRWANGGESKYVRGPDGALREGNANPYVALPPVDGLLLDGHYRYGDGTRIDGAHQLEIRFTPEGRFEESNFCSCVLRDGPKAGRGRYRIANYTLHLEYDTGERVRMGFHVLGKPEPRMPAFYANTFVFSRAK